MSLENELEKKAKEFEGREKEGKIRRILAKKIECDQTECAKAFFRWKYRAKEMAWHGIRKVKRVKQSNRESLKTGLNC